jgi:hypothetical protein
MNCQDSNSRKYNTPLSCDIQYWFTVIIHSAIPLDFHHAYESIVGHSQPIFLNTPMPAATITICPNTTDG